MLHTVLGSFGLVTVAPFTAPVRRVAAGQTDGVLYETIDEKQKSPEAQATLRDSFFASIQNSITSVPPVTSSRPRAARRVSFSWNTSPEKATVTNILSLSMGTTILAGPSCKAR